MTGNKQVIIYTLKKMFNSEFCNIGMNKLYPK